MRGDFSRFTFDPLNHYRSVYMQQGRIQLDADWNEQIDILHHYLEAYLRDLLGPSAGQRETAGFEIAIVEESEFDESAEAQEPRNNEEESGSSEKKGDFERDVSVSDLHIGSGRYYVDGVLYENEHGVFYSAQPDYPDATLPVMLEEH